MAPDANDGNARTERAGSARPEHPDPGTAALRLLVALADRGTLSAAARSIGMAQPNASRMLAGLEVRLGYALVTRRTTGSTLTHEGALTVEWARDVVDASDRLMAGAAAIRGTGGELVIGASMTIAECLAPDWLAALRVTAPEVEATLRIDNSAGIIDAVHRGTCTLGLVETPSIPA
ncbi:MAG: LysR family transcriptional regulator, partial [Pseudoclavibacter sp.]